MLTIRLFCAAGMSTSLLVRKMIEAAEAEGTEVDIIAYPVGEFDQHITGIDCALLGPQVGYMKAQMQAKAKAAGLYEGWYAEALELAGAGVEVSYDDDGFVATEGN